MDTRDCGFCPVARIPAGSCTAYITFTEDYHIEWVTIPGMVSGAALKKNKSWSLVLQSNTLKWCAGAKSRLQSLLGLERIIFTITDEV